MKRILDVALRAFVIVGLAAVMSSAAVAQQKTAKQCRDEWRANEAANKAKGITEAAYVKDCRAGTAAAQPATPPAATPAATTAPAAAATKTAKQCRDEWRANEDANKKAGITEAAYVKDCRAGTTTAAPATPPATTPAAAPGATAEKKTAKACRDEWRANEAANKKAGITEAAYVKDCRAGTTTAQPATAPATPPAATAAPAPAPAPAAAPKTAAPAAPPPAPAQTAAPAPKAAPAPAPAPAPTAATAPTGANQFAAEAQAKAHCPTGLVVWVNTDSKIYHFSGHPDYGKTKEGAYMCEIDAQKAGDRAAKNEKHP